MRKIAVIALIAFAGSAYLNLLLAERARSRPYDVGYVPSAKLLRVATIGHAITASNLYWLSAVQYIGDARADERGWDKLYPLIELVTDLDPGHGYAYQTAGIVLSSAGRIDESNRILLKGISNGPRYWTFPYYLSFNYWFYLDDYENGARYARLAAQTPGASPNVAQLALSLSSKNGTPGDAIALLTELRRGISDEATAKRLDEQLKLAVVERDAQLLEQAANRFRAAFHRDIFGIQELVASGYVRSIPRDPFGGNYTWDREDRRIRSTAHPFRFAPAPRRAQPQEATGATKRSLQ